MTATNCSISGPESTRRIRVPNRTWRGPYTQSTLYKINSITSTRHSVRNGAFQPPAIPPQAFLHSRLELRPHRWRGHPRAVATCAALGKSSHQTNHTQYTQTSGKYCFLYHCTRNISLLTLFLAEPQKYIKRHFTETQNT